MSISAWAIRYRPIVVTVVALLMMWGVYSYFNMPRREDPEYTVRTCVVTTIWPGAPATKVEELITKPLEEILDQLDEVDVVRSTTKVGMSTIYVDTEDQVTAKMIDNVWDKVRARVRRVRMPEEGIVPDVNDEYGDTSVLLLAVHQTPLEGETAIQDKHRYSLRELDIISEQIKDELRLVDGVAKSEQYGVVDEAIFVQTDLGTWSKLNLTTDQLERLAQERNIVASGGSIDTDVGRFSVNPGGEFNAVNELESIVVGLVGEGEVRRPVYLKDMGMRINRSYVNPRQVICRFGDAKSSQPAVIVALTMKSGGNIVTICEAAKDRVRAMQNVDRTIPSNIAVTAVSDQSVNVEAKIWQVMSNVIGAVIIVVIVVYLVVGFRSAAVMAANIPIVVLSALALITIFGVQLEQISLASIIIALGLLVDNAVQVCDQSRSNQMLGMDPVSATVKGSSQVASPMLMGTATTIAAFAPMLFALQGSRLEYLFSLPVTLSVTLAISWLMAMTFCTILAAMFIRAPKDPSRPSAPLPWLMSKLQALFSKKSARKEGNDGGKQDGKQEGGDLIDTMFRFVVRSAIRAKWITLGVAIALFFLALSLPYGSEFFPKDLRDQFPIQIWLPENSSIAQTDNVAKKVEEIIRKLSPSVDSRGESVERLRAMRTMVGRGGSRWYMGWDPEPAQAGFAEILVRTTDGRFTPGFVQDVRRAAEQGNPELGIEPIVGARVVPQELYMGPSSDPVEIRMIGPGFADMATLHRFADRIKAMLDEHPGTWDVNDSWGVAGYEMRVDVDEDKANLAGVSNMGIAQTLNAYFSGHLLTTFREGDHQVPVYLRLKPEQRTSIEGLSNAFVEGRYGKVPLNSFAEVKVGWEPLTIVRRDLNRTIEVRSQVNDGVRGNDVVLEIMNSDAMKQLISELPGGYRVEVGGSLEDSQDGIQEIGMSFGISALVIVLLLVIQYNGWAKPLIILATLPLALIGAIPGLWITGNPLGFMPQLGILALFGIVLNTGIIFIEFADMLIRDAADKSDGNGPICGLTRREFEECLVDAGKQRLLPIFLTTATTVGGLLPLAISGGPLWEGMSWAMIFGLLVATVLTLLVVPALYAILVETFGVKPFHKAAKTE